MITYHRLRVRGLPNAPYPEIFTHKSHNESGGQFNKHKLWPKNWPEIFLSWTIGIKKIRPIFGPKLWPKFMSIELTPWLTAHNPQVPTGTKITNTGIPCWWHMERQPAALQLRMHRHLPRHERVVLREAAPAHHELPLRLQRELSHKQRISTGLNLPPEGPFPGEVVLLLLHVVHGGGLALSGLLHELEMESASYLHSSEDYRVSHPIMQTGFRIIFKEFPRLSGRYCS